MVAPDGDDLYIIPPELTKVVYCDGSLKEPCRPVMGLDASGKTGHVLISFASPDTVYVEHIALSGEYNVAYDDIYVLERCNVVEPGVFSNCEVVRNSPDAYYLDLVFANNGENVYVASATDDSEQDEERFFNPFKYLASLFAFRKPGPNVYVTQHVNIVMEETAISRLRTSWNSPWETLLMTTRSTDLFFQILKMVHSRIKGLFGMSARYTLQTLPLAVNQLWISTMPLLLHGQFPFKKAKYSCKSTANLDCRFIQSRQTLAPGK